MPQTQTQVLANPIWHALNSEHQHFALGNALARRYPAEVSPLAAMASQAPEAYEALTEVVPVGTSVFMFLEEPPKPTERWQVKVTVEIDQMVCEQFLPPAKPNPLINELPESAIPDMLALTKLTNPGPFENKTKSMGRYLGIIQEDRLAALSGERLHLTGYTEVSAVCTHPDFRGRGFARDLVAAVAQGIVNRGETPILHVKSDNWSAIHVYESLGFKKSRVFHFAILHRLF